MSIFKEEHTPVAIWYFAWSGECPLFSSGVAGDCLAGLARVKDGEWYLAYRFRYYTSPEFDPHGVGDNQDRKSWWSGTISRKHSPIADVDALLGMAVAARSDIITPLDKTLLENGHESLVAALATKEWAHFMVVPNEPARG